MSVKPILFIDFDGTLCHDRFWRSLSPDNLIKIQQYLFSPGQKLVVDWMKGVHTSEDIHKKIAPILGLEYDFLWEVFVEDCKTMFVDRTMLKKIQGLRERYTLVLLTDNMDCFERFTMPSLGLEDYFDLIISSSTEKILKNENEGELFENILSRLGGVSTSGILIDDSEKSCHVFEGLGGKSLHVTKDSPLSYWLARLS